MAASTNNTNTVVVANKSTAKSTNSTATNMVFFKDRRFDSLYTYMYSVIPKNTKEIDPNDLSFRRFIHYLHFAVDKWPEPRDRSTGRKHSLKNSSVEATTLFGEECAGLMYILMNKMCDDMISKYNNNINNRAITAI